MKIKQEKTGERELLEEEGVLPYKGSIGTCSQPGYVFRDFCL